MLFPSTSPARIRSSSFAVLALLASALTSGCLEANAAQTDGGATKDGGTATPDTGSSHPSDASADRGAPGADATMTGTPDATDGAKTNSKIPTCKGATAAESACVTCDETSCSANVTDAVGACQAFYACFEGCECTDASCVNKCETLASTTCGAAVQGLATCQKSSCATACATPAVDAGQPMTDASSGSSCKNPTATQKSCAACDESSCAADLTAAETQCVSLYSCIPGCDCSDMSCIDNCAMMDTTACTSALTTLQSCQTSKCAAACSGTAADGGSAPPTIPVCANATSAELTLYNTCSACDATSCQSSVTSAVSSCAAYYACYAACDCGDFLCTDGCAPDLTAACDSAIDALAACQDTSCSAQCS
jgi:hypothetical protein